MIACTGLSPSAACLPRHFQFSSFHDVGVLQPRACRNIPGLGSFPFAHHYLGNHSYFLLLRLLRCFSSSGLPPSRIPAIPDGWVAPFGNPRIKRLFAPPRGLSQLITSFVASESQGIPRALLVTYSFFYSIIFLLSSRSQYHLAAISRLNFVKLISFPSCQRTFKKPFRFLEWRISDSNR